MRCHHSALGSPRGGQPSLSHPDSTRLPTLGVACGDSRREGRWPCLRRGKGRGAAANKGRGGLRTCWTWGSGGWAPGGPAEGRAQVQSRGASWRSARPPLGAPSTCSSAGRGLLLRTSAAHSASPLPPTAQPAPTPPAWVAPTVCSLSKQLSLPTLHGCKPCGSEPARCARPPLAAPGPGARWGWMAGVAMGVVSSVCELTTPEGDREAEPKRRGGAGESGEATPQARRGAGARPYELLPVCLVARVPAQCPSRRLGGPSLASLSSYTPPWSQGGSGHV